MSLMSILQMKKPRHRGGKQLARLTELVRARARAHLVHVDPEPMILNLYMIFNSRALLLGRGFCDNRAPCSQSTLSPSLKVSLNVNMLPSAKANLKEKDKAGGITRPDFKIHYRAVVTSTVRYRHKNRHFDQWDRIEDTEINACVYGQLILDKVPQTNNWERMILSTNGIGKTGCPYAEE